MEQSHLLPSPTSGTSYIRVLLRIYLPRTPVNSNRLRFLSTCTLALLLK